MTRCAFTLGIVVAGAGCEVAAPIAPTWDDVQPILSANCVRCHGANPRGGAPPSFRLDSYCSPGVRHGAAAMAEFIAARAGHLGEMPPLGPLSDRQRDVLERWYENGQAAGASGLPATSPVSTAPLITLLAPQAGAVVDGVVMIDYVLDDADWDAVRGELRFGPGAFDVIPGEVHPGRGSLAWDTGVVPAGEYTLALRLDEGREVFEGTTVCAALAATAVPLATVTVAHEDGNTAPSVRVGSPGGSDNVMFHDDDAGARQFLFTVTDPDPGDVVTADLDAVIGDRVVSIAADLPVIATATGADNTFEGWSSLEVGDSVRWRLRVTVKDAAGASRRAFSDPFIVTHATTTERWQSMEPIFVRNCAPCHSGIGRIPGVARDFAEYDEVLRARALIWRRVIEFRDMPPRSARAIYPSVDAPLGAADRDRLADWLLGGAPR